MNPSYFRRLHLFARSRKAPSEIKQIRNESLNFLRSRLSRRIALSVFGSIVAIEALILVSSIHKYERESLQHLADQSAASLMSLVTDLQIAQAGTARANLTPELLLARLSQLETLPFVAGGALYYKAGPRAGQQIGGFGELPQLTYDRLQNFEGQKFNRRLRRYDRAWVSPLASNYLVIISHDTSGLRRAVAAYIGRILAIVLLISGVVTLATLAALQPILIAPILALRNDLQRAAPAALSDGDPVPATFGSLRYGRDDELGEVIGAFRQMFAHISGAIAQRQQAESELRDSRSWFRSLFQEAAESIFVVNRDGTLADANPYALSCLQYRASELIGQSIFDINPHLTPETYRSHWETLQAGQSLAFEAVHRCKDGRTYPVEVRSSLVYKDGEMCVLSLARDISDRKKAQAVQARLAEVGELAATVVHEVRNPLATIYMALTGLRRLELPSGGQLRLQLALEEAERFKRLLNEILTYSKEPQLADERVEMNRLCRELYTSLRELPAAAERAIRLTPFSQKLFVCGDRDKLKQVFINLVTNACEAIEPGEIVHWTIQRTPKQIQVRVQNGGEPIPPDILPKLTQPFVSTKDSGNGLGLAITKRIVEAHDGTLAIASDAVKGTTVTVLLPLSPFMPELS